MLAGTMSMRRLCCSRHISPAGMATSRRRPLSTATQAAARGFAGEKKKEAKKDTGKGNAEQERRRRLDAAQQKAQQARSIEERFLEKAEARARGEDAPDEAFERRLAALRRRATAAAKEKPPGEPRAGPMSILDAAPVFSDPLDRGDGAPQRSSRAARDEEESTSEGVGKVLLGGGALILAAIFVATSFGDFAPQSRQAPSGQARTLGEEERRDLHKQVAALEADIQGGGAGADTLRRAAAAYTALGERAEASGALEKLTEATPSDSEAWQLLAEARATLGDAKGAVAAYKRAVAEAASPSLALLQGLADSLVSDGRPKEAVGFLTAHQSTPQPGVAPEFDAVDLQLLIGKVYTQWPRHDADALAAYDRIIEQHADDFRGYAAKGVLLRRQGRKGDAQRAFLQARYNAPPELRLLVDKIIAQ